MPDYDDDVSPADEQQFLDGMYESCEQMHEDAFDRFPQNLSQDVHNSSVGCADAAAVNEVSEPEVGQYQVAEEYMTELFRELRVMMSQTEHLTEDHPYTSVYNYLNDVENWELIVKWVHDNQLYLPIYQGHSVNGMNNLEYIAVENTEILQLSRWLAGMDTVAGARRCCR